MSLIWKECPATYSETQKLSVHGVSRNLAQALTKKKAIVAGTSIRDKICHLAELWKVKCSEVKELC